jgi:hypothetical protein
MSPTLTDCRKYGIFILTTWKLLIICARFVLLMTAPPTDSHDLTFNTTVYSQHDLAEGMSSSPTCRSNSRTTAAINNDVHDMRFDDFKSLPHYSNDCSTRLDAEGSTLKLYKCRVLDR